MAEAKLAIEARIRRFAYSSTTILRDILIEVPEGDTLSILGPSGSGKSTLVGVLAGLLPKQRHHNFDGQVELFGLSPLQYRRRGSLGVMFQDPSLLPHMTARENIEAPLRMQKSDAMDTVDDLLQLVGLQDHAGKLPFELSGGMKTRVALARSFVTNPKVLLLDEPFSSLDLGWKESLYGSLQNLRAKFGTTVVLVTHNLEESLYNSNSIAVFGKNGSIVDELDVSDEFPRPYPFSETVSQHTSAITHLASLLTHQTDGMRP